MNTRWPAAASGVLLLAVGWAVGGQWAAIGAGAGILFLAAVVALPGWATGSVLVAAAFVAEVAVAEGPNWVLVVLGAVLLACFLACSEVHESRIGGGWPPTALRPHTLPVLACAVTGVVVAAVSTLSLGDSAVVALVAVGGAVCVALLLLAGTRT